MNEANQYKEITSHTLVRNSDMNTADIERVSASQEEAQALVDEELQSKSTISKILKKIGILGRASISIILFLTVLN